MSITVYYDGNCPFCEKYTTLIRLKETVGTVNLVDLRDEQTASMREQLITEGFDLDKGMVVDLNGQKMAGVEAVNQLALLSTPSTVFNKLNKFILSSMILARLIYPMLRAGRWLVLFLLGREQIHSDDKGAVSRAAIFGSLFALFSFFHFLNYAFEYKLFSEIELDLLCVVFCAVLLFIKPESPRLLFLLMFASTVSAIAQAPTGSNHTIVRNFVILGYWLSFIYSMARGLNWSSVFKNFTVAGQASLFVMYFFGVFHKINSDFLTPETSCAVALWRKMPPPLNLIDHSIMHYLAIYGTFVVEGILVIMLFNRRVRHFAVVGGIGFHLLLGLSNYAMYISFSTLVIALHCLFLNEEAAKNIQESKFMRGVKDRIVKPTYFILAILLVGLAALSAWLRQYTHVTVLLLPVLLPFCYVIIRYGASQKPLLEQGHRATANTIGFIVGALFFLNCWSPYLGFKSAQAVNMFANLRLEAGVSNHLIMKNPPQPFTYLEDVVEIERSTGGEELKYYERDGWAIIYYDLLARLADNPDLKVSYRRGGVYYEDMTAAKLADEIKATLHPAWFRKWFHFQPVYLSRPEPCTI